MLNPEHLSKFFPERQKVIESVIESGRCIRAGRWVDQIVDLLHQTKDLEVSPVKEALRALTEASSVAFPLTYPAQKCINGQI